VVHSEEFVVRYVQSVTEGLQATLRCEVLLLFHTISSVQNDSNCPLGHLRIGAFFSGMRQAMFTFRLRANVIRTKYNRFAKRFSTAPHFIVYGTVLQLLCPHVVCKKNYSKTVTKQLV